MSDIKIEAKEIKMVDVELLIPNPKNNNRHPPEQYERLKKIVSRQGFRVPIEVSNQSGFIVCGHLRYDVACQLGMKQVPVVYQDFESPALEYAHLTAENEISRWAELDKHAVYTELKDLDLDDIELLGLEDFELPDVEELDPQTDEDEVPEVETPITVRGDVWLLGKHRLMCGDSTMIDDVEKLMAGEKADMVFTDPPYNIDFKPQRGTHDKIKNDNMSEDDFNEFLYSVFSVCKTVLNKDTYLISFMGWSTTHNFRYALKDFFTIKSMPIWVKNNFGIGYYTRPKYEPFYLCLNGDPIKPTTAPADVFEFNKVHKTIHSCEKPVDMLIGIADHFNRNGLFYEPFGGSGSMLIACEKTNRKNYSMELDEKYCDVIINRYMNYTGRDDVTLESTGEKYNDLKKSRV